jgi:hypothetical protein
MDGEVFTYTPASPSDISTGNPAISAFGGGTWGAYYMIIMPKTVNFTMPTYTIGSGIPYLANSTTLDRVFYSYTSNYASNPLYQIYTYDIPDSFSDNYISLYSNGSWAYESSSGYATYYPSINALTFSNISGVGTVQATFLQPSQEIGQPSFIGVSAISGGQEVPLYSGFEIDASYTPFDSSQTYYINGTSSELQIPFGSTANITILNAWNQEVGSIHGLIVDQSTLSINIPVSVSDVSFQFVNTTASTVNIIGNGITQAESGYQSFYVANNTEYKYSASIYDSSLGHNVNYTGTFLPHASADIVYINATAPLAELQVYANAYSGSQLGQLSSGGADRVEMTINGIPTDLGSDFIIGEGSTANIRIFTVLNQTLYTGSILISSLYLTDTITITAPSYEFELRNAEQINETANSTLGTEVVNLYSYGNGYNYSTTNMIGQTLSLYLLAGDYHLYLHDNLTYSGNISVTSNYYRILFGQALLTSSQYSSTISKLYDNSVGLSFLSVNAPSEVAVGQAQELQFEAFYSNSTQVTGAQLKWLLSNTTITVGNASSSLLLTPTISGDMIYANYTPEHTGSFTVKIIGGFNMAGATLGGHYSYPITVASTSEDSGLHLYISGATSTTLDNNYTYYLQFEYSNGTSLSGTASDQLFANLSVEFNGYELTPSQLSDGDYEVNVDANVTGSNLLTASGYFMHDGYNLSTSSFYVIATSSTSSNIVVVPVDVPSSVLVNASVSDKFFLEYSNGTLAPDSLMESLANSSSLTLENTEVLHPTIAYYNGYIYINYTLPDTGYYTLTWTSQHGIYSLLYSTSVQGITNVQDTGMHMAISGPSAVYEDESYYYYFVLTYDNGSLLSKANTLSAYSNMTVSLYDGSTLISSYTPNVQSNGVIYSEISVSGVYSSLSLKVSTHLNDGYNLSAANIFSLSSVSTSSTSEITIVPVDTPSSVLTNLPASFVFKAQFANGTYLTDSQWNTMLSTLSISIMNTNTLSYTTYVSADQLYLNTTPTANGYYTISISGSVVFGNVTDSVVSSMTFASSEVPPVDTGMHMQIIGPSTIAATSGITVHKITLSGVPSGTGTYQQLITINNPADYGINSNGSNILFFDNSNLTELYAWEQSVNSSAIQVWIKNYNSSSVIDMEVLASSDNEFSANGYLGEAPTLSTTYGQYDNGKMVFEFYDNFAGTALSPGWTSMGGSSTLTVDNGVTITPVTVNQNDVGYYNSYQAPQNSVVDALYTDTGSGTVRGGGIGFGTAVYTSSVDRVADFSTVTASPYWYIENNTASASATTPVYASGSQIIFSGAYTSTEDVLYENYVPVVSMSVKQVTSPSNVYFAAYGDTIHLQWIRVRTYESSMPTFTIGNAIPYIANSTTNYYVQLTYTNGTLFSSNNTHMALDNMTFNIVQNGIVEYIENGTYYEPGIISVPVALPAGSFILNATDYLNNGVYLRGTALLPVTVDAITSPVYAIPIDTPDTVPLNTSIPYIFEFQYANGTLLDSSALSSLASGIQVSIRNSQTLTSTTDVNGDELYVYFDITSPGYYTFSMNGVFNKIYSYSYYQHVESQPVVNNGLEMQVTGASTAIVNNTYDYYIMLSLDNGNTLNHSQTESALANLSIDEKIGGNTISTASGAIIGNGTIEFSITPDAVSDSFSLYITDHIGSDSTSSVIPVDVVSNYGQIIAIPVDTPTTTYVNSSVSYKLELEYPDGKLLNATVLNSIIANSTLSIENSADVVPSITSSGNYAYINFTLTASGYYTVSWTSHTGIYSLAYSGTINAIAVPQVVIINHGIKMQLTGPGSLALGQAGTYYIILDYENGSTFSSADTADALANMTIQALLGSNAVENITPTEYSQGIIMFTFSYPSAAFLSLKASTHLNDGKNVSGTYMLPVDVESTTTNIGVIAYDTPQEAQTGQAISYEFQFQTSSGSLLDSTEIGWLLANASISIRNTASLPYTTSISGNLLYVNFTSSDAGYFTFSMSSSFASGSNVYSLVFHNPIYISVPPITDNGMSLFITGPSSIQDGTGNSYFITLFYRNGTSFNISNTDSANLNLTVDLYEQSGALVGSILHSVHSAGIIEVDVNVSNSGSYFLLASSHLNNPSYVSASNVLDFSAISGKSIQKINVMPIDTPSNYLTGENGTYVYELAYENGTILGNPELQSILPYLNITLLNSEAIQPTIAISGSHLLVNFTFTGYGYYTLTIYGSYVSGLTTYSISHSQQITVGIIKVSKGVKEVITVPGTIQAKNATTGTILYSLVLSNSTNARTPDEQETLDLMANSTVELLYHGDFAGTLKLYYIQPGESAFSLNISQTGTGYQIVVITKPTDISGQNVSFTGTSQSFTVSSANPANPQTGWDQFQKIITGLDAQIFYLVVSILTVLYYGYKYIRRREIELEKEENQAGLMLEADVLHDGLIYKIENKPMPPELAAIFDAIPASRRNKIFGMITSRRKIKFPVPKFLQKKNMSGGKK